MPGVQSGRDTAFPDPLTVEIAQERAASLGRAGRRIEAAAASYAAEPTAATRRALTHAVWAYIVQREACGLRRHGNVLRHFDIPSDILRGFGIRR